MGGAYRLILDTAEKVLCNLVIVNIGDISATPRPFSPT